MKRVFKRTVCMLSGMSRHPVIAAKGAREFRGSAGATYDGDPSSPRSVAYDSGRETAHVVTGRKFES